jgi:pimeloyl-ACP methyl ester carboxylesterase
MYEDSRYLTIHGLSIHYRIINPEGEVTQRILLVSSPGQSTHNWRSIVPELTKAGCRCVLCDLPGFGLSDCKDDAPQDHDTRAQFLWGLLDTVDLEDGEQLNCWHLMAHGSACGTIASMALLQPDSVSSMVMLAPILYPPLPPFIMNLASKPFASKLISAWMKRHICSSAQFRKIACRVYGKQLKPRTVSLLRSSLLGLIEHEALICRLLTDGFTLDTKRLNDLYVPTMVLWASRDALLGDRIPARLRSDIAHAEYHTLPTGHFLHETNSRAMCDFLRGWMKCFTAGSNF